MKPADNTTRSGPFIPALALITALALAGCGNKSGLVLPPDPQSQAPDAGNQSSPSSQPEQKQLHHDE